MIQLNVISCFGSISVHTFGTQTMKQRWAHGLVGLASGAGAGKATLENGSFDDDVGAIDLK